MKNKKWLIISVCVILLAAFLLGVTGAVSFKDDGSANRGDRLIGIFITREHMSGFDSDKYFEENIGQVLARGGGEIPEEDILRYGGRVWATLKETQHPTEDGGIMTEQEYVFEGYEGYRIMYPYFMNTEGAYGAVNSDDEISDVQMSIDANDYGEVTKAKGTIYIVRPDKEDVHFFFNPVYQTASGRVYALSGNSVSFSHENASGTSMGMTLSGNETHTENGRETVVNGREINVEVKIVDHMEKISVLQFGADNVVLKSEEFLPGQLPEDYTPLKETEYIIVDTERTADNPDEVHDRQIFSKQSEFMTAFVCRDDGICTKQHCEILWPGKTSEQ